MKYIDTPFYYNKITTLGYITIKVIILITTIMHSITSQNSAHKITRYPCKIHSSSISKGLITVIVPLYKRAQNNMRILQLCLGVWSYRIGPCSSHFLLISLNPSYALGLAFIQCSAPQEIILLQLLAQTPACSNMTKHMLPVSETSPPLSETTHFI